MIRHVALFLNFFCPGLGSLVLGKWRAGLAQFALAGAAILAFANGFHMGIALIAIAIAWGWGLYTAEYSPRTGGVVRKREV